MTWRVELETHLRHEARPPHKFSHQSRLYQLTLRLIELTNPKPAYDDDVVYAAAFLHDLGVFVGHRPEDPAVLQGWDHVGYACKNSQALLLGFGFPAVKVPLVLDCIREHQPQDMPHSLEATLLRDADILEQLGAIAVLRTVSKVGSDTRFHTFADAIASLRRALDELPAKLRLDSARMLAEPKIAALRSFLEAVEAEGRDHLA